MKCRLDASGVDWLRSTVADRSALFCLHETNWLNSPVNYRTNFQTICKTDSSSLRYSEIDYPVVFALRSPKIDNLNLVQGNVPKFYDR